LKRPDWFLLLATRRQLAVASLSACGHHWVFERDQLGQFAEVSGVELRWWIEGERLHLVWRELGVPKLEGPPPRVGFGSKLIKMMFEGQIKGKVTRHWETEGLVCQLSLPFRSKE
jgi:hypothetical protein